MLTDYLSCISECIEYAIYGWLGAASFNYVNDYDSVESVTDPHAKYDRMSWTVLPTLAVFMPVADARRITSMDFTTSVVSCLGIKFFNQGSRVPVAAPDVPPTNSHVQRLNGGAIAGIAIGSVVSLGVAWVMLSLYRLRRSKANRVGIDPNGDQALQMDLLGPVEAGSEGAVQEINFEEAHIERAKPPMKLKKVRQRLQAQR